ncbi:uncharacterized protein B0H18DRAFT_1040457 [Fomitopsis serialis]|uniref:uncharacterized protein n=1 Tax=Fomitopsis serialis TaxID=139415 RepID=UPI002007787A|nr:uncharacterized protein B0H18DRAFT_1040457 [Neoantrodia serialis]KAH9915690.1 hypothetical protein B0H18DRAFT_1040457 [Neoantrodia serialis]
MPVDPSSVALEKDRIHNDKRTSVRYNCKRAVKRGLPVIDFVRTVWRFTPDMLPEGQPYRLWRTTVNRFLQQGSERESYTHFASIITDLLAQLYPDASVYGASSPLRKLNTTVINTRATSNRTMIRQGGSTPDLTWSQSTSVTQWRLNWESCLAFVEIKRPSAHGTLVTDLVIDVKDFPYIADWERAASGSGVESDVDAEYEVDSEYDSDLEAWNVDIKRKRSTSIPDMYGPVTKRVCREDSLTSMTSADPPEYDTEPLNNQEMDAALYIMEMLERNLRSYATGFSVDRTMVTLWYGDRMGLVASEAFDFLIEPHLLLLVVAAMGAADEERFGICPYLKAPTCGDYDNAEFVLPSWKALNAYGEPINKTMQIKLCHGGRLMRGLSYVVVSAATMIFNLQATTEEEDGEELVAKVSWPLERSATETSSLRAVLTGLRKKATQYLKHVTELKCYIEETMAEHRLPRANMPGLNTEKPRLFVLMVMKKYEPIYHVASVTEFKTLFADVVRAHYWVAETSDVLHGDISLNNIMFYRENGRVIGVLMDWDHSVRRNREEEDKFDLELPSSDDPLTMWVYRFSFPGHWYTAPYLDVARQSAPSDEVPPYRYEHDLEAFFWVLMHFLQQFDPARRTMLPTQYFNMNSNYDIVSWKQDMLEDLDGDAFQDAAARVHRDYLPLWDDWVPELLEIVATAHSYRMDTMQERTLRCQLKTASEAGEQARVDRLVRRLRAKVEQRKSAFNYETFMAAIDAPEDIDE